LDETPYIKYLKGIDGQKTHSGYFSIDKKTKRDVTLSIAKTGENKGLSDDVDAYDLILKEGASAVKFEEPVRFIFSHSALREGWDNPNVFVICFAEAQTTTTRSRADKRWVVVCVLSVNQTRRPGGSSGHRP
jgi:type III restriction enzyme